QAGEAGLEHLPLRGQRLLPLRARIGAQRHVAQRPTAHGTQPGEALPAAAVPGLGAQAEAGVAALGEAVVVDPRVLRAEVRRQRQSCDVDAASRFHERALVAPRQRGADGVAGAAEQQVALHLALEAAGRELALQLPVAVPARRVELHLALLAAAAVAERSDP